MKVPSSSILILAILVPCASFADESTRAPKPSATAPSAAEFSQKDWSQYTPSAREIVRMKSAGIDDKVLRAYIENSKVAYNATAEDILFLHQNKISDELISDWIKHGGELAAQGATPAQSPDLAASAAPAPQPAPVATQQPTVVYQAAPQVATPPVVYSSPTYIYPDYSPYYYSPPITFGFSYGFGRPYWGHSHFYAPVHIGFSHHFGGGFRGGAHFHGGGHFGGHHR
jgi:hypothetical protein